MKKNDLLRKDNNIIRVLEIEDDKALVIDCVKRSMPKWVDVSNFVEYGNCSVNGLLEETGFILEDVDKLSAKDKSFIHTKYTLISGVLPFVDDEIKRSDAINRIAEQRNVSPQTIRKYLCLYLVYQNITAFLPKKKTEEKILSPDEKNMRWALNKYFYTKNKNSLKTAYTFMLKEKYCSSSGELMEQYPSFNQFRYFYRKHKSLQTLYISRNGLKDYQRNNRPLIGAGIHEFAPNIGVGMIDSTICDIYLINEEGKLVGRPILTACVDAYSSLCCGYSLSWEGGVYSIKKLMMNIISNKNKWCKSFGIDINNSDWASDMLPATLVTDKGSEYTSENFEHITELGVTVINLPAYRPELKGAVEKFFDVVQNLFKPSLKGKGVIETNFQERGAHDYRKDACLTMEDFEKIILHCIIFYNSKRILEHFPYTEKMMDDNVRPHASCIWNWSANQPGANLIKTTEKELTLTLLPRTAAKFSRYGLKVNKLRYNNDAYTEEYLQGNSAVVAYDPDNVNEVWLLQDGKYVKFELIETRFENKTLVDVEEMKRGEKDIINSVVKDNLQAKIELIDHIRVISDKAHITNVNIYGVRATRKKERLKNHLQYSKEEEENEEYINA